MERATRCHCVYYLFVGPLSNAVVWETIQVVLLVSFAVSAQSSSLFPLAVLSWPLAGAFSLLDISSWLELVLINQFARASYLAESKITTGY